MASIAAMHLRMRELINLPTMKTTTICAVLLALGIALPAPVFAQDEGETYKQETDRTSVSDSPFLRKRAAAPTRQGTPVAMNPNDKNFLLKAVQAHDEEIALGKLGQSKGQSAAVKKIGAMMVADHTRLNKEVTALAEKKGLRITSQSVQPGNISSEGFDKVWLDAVGDHHKKDIALFQQTARGNGDKDIKAFAAKNLPSLQKHLAAIKQAGG